ncbi:MAG: hypothetical protein LBJ31_12045 [Treponema sp.]|nr:hypothetical protein [Treponema sp.]
MIIYFLVISGFSPRAGIPLSLETGFLPEQSGALYFSIDSRGRLYYAGSQIDEDDVRGIVGARNVVVLSADDETPWQSIVSFVDLTRELKVETFSFAGLSARVPAGERQ